MKYKMFVDDDGELKEVLDTGEFDALRQLIAQELAKYLPLSGGTMTGAIFAGGDDYNYLAVRNRNDRHLIISGGTNMQNGATVIMYGKDNASRPGYFELEAQDSEGYVILQGRPDGRLTWGSNVILTADMGSLIPAGTVIAFAGNPRSAPSGFLLCNGAAVSRTTYAALFAAIGTTYGAGNGSSTFALPNLTDKFIQGSGTAGTVKAAGLPNIKTESRYMSAIYQDITSGAVLYSGAEAGAVGSGGSNIYRLNFDASRGNAIYGASTTVQPPALTMRYYIKY